MSRSEVISAEAKGVADDWAQTGANLYQAMMEKAEELGGEDLREEIQRVAWRNNQGPLPDANALIMLNVVHAEAAQEVMVRAEEIAQQIREKEIRDSRSRRNIISEARALGAGMLRMFG